jgi:hypothetical protein
MRRVALAIALLGATASSARADVIVRGWVVELESGEMYCDLGTVTDIKAGLPLRVMRPIKLHHPVSGKLVEDELPLGELTVDAVGDKLVMAHPGNTLLYPAQVGDVAMVLVPREEKAVVTPKKQEPATQPVVVETPLPEEDEAEKRVLATWSATTHQSLDARIATWEAYLQANPTSPYGDGVKQELVELRAYREQFVAHEPNETAQEPTVDGIVHAAPHHWPWRQPISLSFLVADPSRVANAWIHYRRRGSDTFHRLELRRDGDGYLRGALDGSEADGPGFEYFVEVVSDRGLVASAVGTAKDPIVVAVDAPQPTELSATKQNRSRVSLSSAYANFGTNDYLYTAEADFFYRLRTHIYGIRMGGGLLDGKGGFIDPSMEPDQLRAFHYGYTEIELRASPRYAFLARGVVGVGTHGLGGGGEARVRLGAEDETNLTFGVSSLTEVGFLTELKLSWAAFPNFPLGLGVALTNQPNPDGDLAVRFTADVGLRKVAWFRPTVGVSYQGRSVDHSGLGVSLGMVFDW